MKRLKKIAFDARTARSQWQEFSKLLASKATLRESKDILPFFRRRNDLSALLGSYLPAIRNFDSIAHEYQIYGDFCADLIVGDSATRTYLLIEFEDGSANSVFRRQGAKANPDWARRFEGAFSQLVDWLWKLEDMRNTSDFESAFGRRDARFEGLIIAGKNMNLGPYEEARLRWRTSKVMVDSKPISVRSFDGLHNDLDYYLKYYNV